MSASEKLDPNAPLVALRSPLEVRSHLVNALEADLVGPYQQDAGIANHEPELLKLPPSRWYLTGFLAPMAHRDAPSNEEEEQFAPTQDAETSRGYEAKENEDDQAPRPRNFFPASVGLSVLIEPSEAPLVVRVRYANYRKKEDPDKPGLAFWAREAQPQISVELPLDPKMLEKEVRLCKDDDLYLKAELRSTSHKGQDSAVSALSVFLVNRRSAPEKGAKDASYIFQVELQLEYAPGFAPRLSDASALDADFDAQLSDLQYRNRAEYAIGHGISVAPTTSNATGQVTQVTSTWIPRYEVPMVTTRSESTVETRMEALAKLGQDQEVETLLAPLVQAYGAWIEDQASLEVGSEERAHVQDLLLRRAGVAKTRIRAGIDALKNNPELLEVFRLANDAIARSARQRSPERYNKPDRVPRWRLFQLAFLLINLPAIADPTHKDRKRVELIYFPTGGGKTEAYLGVIALYLFWRRMQGQSRPDKGLGVTVLLRYTLRMLTQDQLGRAATLICAMETIRREQPQKLGSERFSVGMWVGGKSTPNRLTDAEDRIKDLRNGRGASPCPLTACPWCSSPLGADALSMEAQSNAGSKKKEKTGVLIGCSNASCEFSLAKSPRGIPVLFVDDQIYKEPPMFLIATVDKFAMVPWRDKAGHLFGKVKARQGDRCFGHGDKETVPKRAKDVVELPDGFLPPELVVQDELHLISGPLGTMVGLFETAIEQLCSRELQTPDGPVTVLPKIVAATATVRNAPAQINALFGRTLVSQFPPAGVNDDDNYFAHVDTERPGRLYIGVCASGRRMKATLLRTYVTLGAAAQHAYLRNEDDLPEVCDGYMTLVGYFNSIRELGGMRRLVEDQTLDLLSRASRRKPASEPEHGRHQWSADRRIQREPIELTSRESGEGITDAKRRLELPFSSQERVDVVLASNMISVGVDINRLAVMVVAGQPKTTSEYIQSSSRVGRDPRWPGLVVTCLNPYKPRDRSHYERFVAYHDSLYRFVEATSATPFSGPALDRGLAGALVAMARHGHPELTPGKSVTRLAEFRDVANQGVAFLGAKAESLTYLDATARKALRQEIENRAQSLLDSWETQVHHAPQEEGVKWFYSKLDQKKGSIPLMRTHEEWKQLADESFKTGALSTSEVLERQQFVVPQSMRETERNIHMWVQHALFELEEDAQETQEPRKKRPVWGRQEKITLEGELRPSQLLSQFGPGAMVDLVDRSVIISSIDYWNYKRGEAPPMLQDDRLMQKVSHLVAEDFSPRRELKGLREAPVCDTQSPSRSVGIQALEFPHWFVCQNPKCRALRRKSRHWELKDGRYYHECDRNTKAPFIPVRFVGACSKGHIQDFPWHDFAHADAPANHPCTRAQSRLRMVGGSSGDFGEIRIHCDACGQSRALAKAMVEPTAHYCSGKRPWLGPDADEECDEKLRLIVRTASNAYFPQTISSLSIPVDTEQESSAIQAAVQANWTLLKDLPETSEGVAAIRALVQPLDHALRDFSNQAVCAEIARQKAPSSQDDVPLRTREYLTFLDAPPQSHAGEVPEAGSDFFARALPPANSELSQVGRVVVAKKLREIRVLTGFSRIDGISHNLQGEFDEKLNIRRAPIRHTANWLPATELRGEGLLFLLDEDKVRAWEERPEVQDRAQKLLRGHEEKFFDPKHPDKPMPEFPGVRYYMLHSLSHVLMGAISMECGYPASSIRERIYCASSQADLPMAGILLSTGTAGAEGSLGGLVQEGQRLHHHLKRALSGASLCTHDPICASHEPGGSHDDRHLEAAACHGCLYVAECSCERFNQYLDRALLVPTVGNDPRLALFGKEWI